MREGGCLCGAVRYQVAGEPVRAGICHCRTCRKTGSAPALPFAVFPADALTFTTGWPAEFRSSPDVSRGFCANCGSPLTYRNDQNPGLVDVMTCSLDDPNTISPEYHVWVSHKLAWEQIPEGLPTHATTRAGSEQF